MANTAFDHASALTLPGSTTNNGLVRWGDTSASSFGNITGITSDGSNLTLLTRGEIRFSDADSSHYIALESPATVSTSYTMALPAAVPSANDYLKVTSYSGGAGVSEWASVSADTNTTYSTSWVDSTDDAILRLTPSTGSADDLTIVAGSGITLTPSGDNLTIASSGGAALTGSTDNTIVTVTGSNAMQGESTLTYTGTAMMIGLAASPPTPDHTSVHIWEGSAGSLTSSTDMQLVVENSGNAGIAIMSPNANSTQLAFGSPQDNRQGGILYDHNTNSLHLRAAGITVMELDTSGFGGQPKIKVGTATNNTFGFWTKNTQNVSTTLTYIIAGSDNVTDQGALVFVSGRESSGSQHKFYDLLMHTYRDTTSAGPTVISSSNASSPSARTYDQNQSGLRLRMASGTYDVSVFVISAPNVN